MWHVSVSCCTMVQNTQTKHKNENKSDLCTRLPICKTYGQYFARSDKNMSICKLIQPKLFCCLILRNSHCNNFFFFFFNIGFIFKPSIKETFSHSWTFSPVTCRLVLTMGHFLLSCNLLWRRKEVRQSATAAMSLKRPGVLCPFVLWK